MSLHSAAVCHANVGELSLIIYESMAFNDATHLEGEIHNVELLKRFVGFFIDECATKCTYPLIFAACQAKEGFNWRAYLPLEFCMNKKAARDGFKIILGIGVPWKQQQTSN